MKQNEKPKQGIPRLLEISGEKNTPFAASVLLSILGTLCQLVPFLSIYQVMAELLRHTATGAALHTDFMIRWALYGLAGLIVGYVLAYAGGMMAHTFAYRVICGVRLKVAEHIGKLPMGYVTNNSIGKTKQVLDADVEQIETFLAHQLPDFVSTIVMLLAMFIIMFSQNVWLALACLEHGLRREGEEMLLALLERGVNYGAEPFVLAADVYSNPYRAGEAGWTWYTGSAGWYLRAALAAWGEPKDEVETKFKEN